jgi:hypothetical protein
MVYAIEQHKFASHRRICLLYISMTYTTEPYETYYKSLIYLENPSSYSMELGVVCGLWGLMSKRATILPNRPRKFKDRDIVRIVNAARMAGVDVKTVMVDPRSGVVTVRGGGDDTGPDRDTPERIIENL